LIKIVLITVGQPSVNPRIVKEADALADEGYEVTLLYSYVIKWASEKDVKLLENVKWKYKEIGGSPTSNKLFYIFTKARVKFFYSLQKLVGFKLFSTAERIQARAHDELIIAAKKIKADWYIGHNLGALAIAVKAAEYNNAKAGFDFEDYHRGEGHDKNTLERIIFLENKYIPSLSYYSTASELITVKTALDHISFNGKLITLLNCFPLNQQPNFNKKIEEDKTLNLFWFSQTIGINRGLEILIQAIKNLNNTSIHLTLAGKCNDDILAYIKTNAGKMLPNIHFAGIIQPEDLPTFAAKFDVGMAIELSEPYNRDICLTNKIFTYLLAGNAIILSQTAMQNAFNKQYKIGESFAVNNVNELAEKITSYLDIKKLNVQKKYNYELAKDALNWENESKKLLAIIN
jgi:glycosyltransferase involved in cell wall biosynthesis